MTRHVPAILICLLSSGMACSAHAAESSLKNRSISSSKQFVIYATNPTVRSEVSQRAELFKTTLLEFLGIDDEFKFTIILNLEAPTPTVRNPPKSRLGLYQLDGDQLKVQLDVFDPNYLKDPAFESDLMATLLLEYAYRNNPAIAGRSFETPPTWVVDGLLERLRVRTEGISAPVYATLLASGKSPRVDDFFRTRTERLDPTSRAIFRAQSLAMLDTLRELPDGRPGLHAYLAIPRRSPPSAAELVALFPSLEGDREALGRHWVLSIARASASNRVDLLTIRESANRLAQILDIKALPDPKKPEVAAMSGPFALGPIARSQSGPFILAQMRDELLRLSIRAHPLYKSLSDEYLQIVTELLNKPKRRLEKRIAAAEEIRASLSRQSTEMDGYLDWVEATKIKTESDEFTAIVEDTEAVTAAPPRSDAVSRYLDAYSERSR